MLSKMKIPEGVKVHGSIYSGPSANQDEDYRRRVEAKIKARALKLKREKEAEV